MWTITVFSFMHRVLAAFSQVKGLLCASPCRTIPSISTRRTQAIRLFAQAIHIAVHSSQGRLVRITVAQAPSDLAQPVELACLSVAGRTRERDAMSGQDWWPAGVDAGLLRRSDGGSSACSGQHRTAGDSGEQEGNGRRQQSELP